MADRPMTPKAYLDSLPDDRRKAVSAIRATIRKNLNPGFKEACQDGAIVYLLPHSVYPDGYHCDPSQPLPFGGVKSQKNHIGIYLFCLYCDENEIEKFVSEWKATGKKLDMGKSCIRVKKLEDVPLDVLGRAIKRVTAKKFISSYEASRDGARSARSAKKATKKVAKKTAEKTTTKKKTAPKR